VIAKHTLEVTHEEAILLAYLTGSILGGGTARELCSAMYEVFHEDFKITIDDIDKCGLTGEVYTKEYNGTR
jgi:hypothetical protein